MSFVYKHGRNDICIPLDFSHSAEKIHQFVSDVEVIPCNAFYLTFNGRYVQSDDLCSHIPCTIQSYLRVPGGKGGFGSMLRAIGAKIEKTTNHEACRDLSGRRMRDVNHEKAIGEWVKKKEVDDTECKEKRIKKLERMINPQHHYEDVGYTSNLQLNAEKIDGAIKEALQKRDEKNGSKRKMLKKDSVGEGKQKKGRMWIGYSDEESDSDIDSGNIVPVDHIDKPCCSKQVGDDVPNNKKSCKEGIRHTDNRKKKNGIKRVKSFASSIEKKTVENVKEGNSSGGSNAVNFSFCKYEACGEDFDGTDGVMTSSSTDETVLVSSCTNDKNELSYNSNVEEKNPSEIQASETTHGNELASFTNVDEAPIVDKEEPVNLVNYDSCGHLESVGLERLKSSLMLIGLKCGGTLQERAQRLYMTKHTPLENLDPSLFAKPPKGKKKSKR